MEQRFQSLGSGIAHWQCVELAISLGFTILGEIFAYVAVFESNRWGGHIPSLCVVHAGCVFVASIHLSGTWMSGSFESLWWNASVHRLDLGFSLIQKSFLGNGVRIPVNSKGKIPSTGLNFPQWRIKPTTLHQAGQRTQHFTSELFRPPVVPTTSNYQ